MKCERGVYGTGVGWGGGGRDAGREGGTEKSVKERASITVKKCKIIAKNHASIPQTHLNRMKTKTVKSEKKEVCLRENTCTKYKLPVPAHSTHWRDCCD